jgi:tetratricopeptide (TPR) repeat protein
LGEIKEREQGFSSSNNRITRTAGLTDCKGQNEMSKHHDSSSRHSGNGANKSPFAVWRQGVKSSRAEAIAAVKAEPEQAAGWYALGRLLALEGEKEKARDCFSRAVGLDPGASQSSGLRETSSVELPNWM